MNGKLSKMTAIQGLVAAGVSLGVLAFMSADRSVAAQEVPENPANATPVETPLAEESLEAAQSRTRRGPRGGPGPIAPPRFGDIDANDDGQISREEFEAFESTRRARGPEGGRLGRAGPRERREEFEQGPRRGFGRQGPPPGRPGRGGLRGGRGPRFRDGQAYGGAGSRGQCDCIDCASQGRYPRDEYSRDRGRGLERRYGRGGYRPPPPRDYRR